MASPMVSPETAPVNRFLFAGFNPGEAHVIGKIVPGDFQRAAILDDHAASATERTIENDASARSYRPCDPNTDVLRRNPITGTACCARAETGHATAAPQCRGEPKAALGDPGVPYQLAEAGGRSIWEPSPAASI
jgi:hypothetical protein